MTFEVPRIRRSLLIVLLSHDGLAVFLRRHLGHFARRPPQWPVPTGLTETKALRKWRRLHAALPAMTLGTVTGRMSVMVEAELHLYAIVILKLSAPADTSSLPHDGSWHALPSLAEAPVFPAELPHLIEGYVNGWIPDGLITLDS
ncbi:hypothetical protein ABZ895_20485 [Streptomyces californicus]|uniref:hypothetical protein n=1 Tax=Streptomyces californicus TaxID=67351 RepID=UPI0033E4C146